MDRRGLAIDYPALLERDEEYLYRNLSDPHRWPLPLKLTDEERAAQIPLFAFARPEFRTAEEIRQDRRRRTEEHQRAAHDLRWWAENEQDADRRTKFEQAAQLHDAFAQTLEALSWEALEDVSSAHEKWIACRTEVQALERERNQLIVRYTWGRSKRLRAINGRLECLREEMRELAHEQEEATARSRPEWEALEEAKRLMAEADGLAKFKQLVPDIRTRLCTQWNACEMIKQYQDETALTMAVGDVLN